MNRYVRKERLTQILSYTMLVTVALLFIFPLIWMLSIALKPDAEVFLTPPQLVGSRLQWDNFTRAWTALPFNRFIINSFIVAGGSSFITVFASAMAAYPFAKIHFPGRELLFLLYMSTLMIPAPVTIVPLFIIVRNFDWINSFQALILPVSFSAFGTFLIRQFMMTIPNEFEDSGRMDGANRIILFSRIILPMVKPALATLAIFAFVGQWGNFLWPLIVINSRRMMTIPLGLDRFLGQYSHAWNLMMAAATISVVPSIIIFLLFQRYLTKGIVLSGLGGR